MTKKHSLPLLEWEPTCCRKASQGGMGGTSLFEGEETKHCGCLTALTAASKMFLAWLMDCALALGV